MKGFHTCGKWGRNEVVGMFVGKQSRDLQRTLIKRLQQATHAKKIPLLIMFALLLPILTLISALAQWTV
jgi:hypothetical protein